MQGIFEGPECDFKALACNFERMKNKGKKKEYDVQGFLFGTILQNRHPKVPQ